MSKSGISIFLRRYRDKCNLTREALAETLDISTSYLASLEMGSRKPAYGTLIHIVNTLRVSADDVLGTDGYVGKVNEVTELSVQLNRLAPAYRKYAIANLKLILDTFSDIDALL